MLGSFLEIALPVDDPQNHYAQFLALEFASADSYDVYSHAYGVVACQGLALGFHAAGFERPALVTVRPNVAELHRLLGEKKIAIQAATLGSDAFNQLQLQDPAGFSLRVLEARSFSDSAAVRAETRLGRFWRLSVPAQDLEAVAQFWHQLETRVMPTGDPWPSLAIAEDLPLTYHAATLCARPLLIFRHADPSQALASLETQGFSAAAAHLPLEAAHCRLPGPGIDLLLLA
jgi:hypothetical protein